jgi:uncharacterized protein YdaU (DUF1376 family)
MSSRPWMPFYIADYLKDTRRLSTIEHGAYLLLIMEYWTAGELPDNDEQLRRITGMTTKEWRRSKSHLQSFFFDGWRHKRLDMELARSAEISSKRSASAKKMHANAGAKVVPLHTHARASSQSQSQSQLQSPKKEPPIGGTEADVPVRPTVPKTKKSKRIPQTTFPDDFILTAKRVQVAADANLDAEATFQDMRRKAIHKQITSADWDIYWVIWCSRQVQYNRERPSGRGIAFAVHEDGSPVHQDE